MNFIVRVLVTALALWLTSLVLDDHLFIVGGDSAGATIVILLAVSLLFTLVNSIVKPLLQFISIPLYILTLGLFHLVINALMLMLTAWITEATQWGIRLEGGFWWAVWIALILAVVNAVINAVVPGDQSR
ncbi:putative membrane protein [Paraoerskovia marina]|uniref:Putative membrane protein n=1 Tax=Paraoerskovia marina TaxID=545619 RepID=A0A1H1M1P2_9CELL|nr:phage holin family protein [Paraoerskovia marina]SDR80570.1 putative membrane protein [Paraoerskovia marina]